MRRRKLLAVLPLAAVAGCTEIITDDTIDYQAQPAIVEPSVVDEQGYELEETDSITIEEDLDLPVLGERDVFIENHIATYSKTEIDESTIEEIEQELADDVDLDDIDPEDVDLDDIDPEDVDLDDIDPEDVDPEDVDPEDIDLDNIDPEDVDVDREEIYTDDVDFGGLDEGEQTMGVLLLLSTPKAEIAGQGANPIGRVPLQELVDRISDMASEEGEEEIDLDHVETTEITVLETRTDVEKYASTLESDDGEELDVLVYVTRVGHEDDYVVGVGILPELLEIEEPALFEMLAGIDHPARAR